MSTILGLVFVFFAYSYFKNAMDPSKLSRVAVQAMCALQGAMSLLIAAILIFAGMNGV